MYPPPETVWEIMSDAARVAVRPVRKRVGLVVGEAEEREIARRVRREERREEVIAGWEGVGRVERRVW